MLEKTAQETHKLRVKKVEVDMEAIKFLAGLYNNGINEPSLLSVQYHEMVQAGHRDAFIEYLANAAKRILPEADILVLPFAFIQDGFIEKTTL